MIHIPIKTLSDVFDNSFKCGSVWFYKGYYFSGTRKKRDKYLIVLNAKAIDGNAYFLFPSSQVDKVVDNKLTDSFVISKGQSDCFPEKTVVDASNILGQPFERIRKEYIKRPFQSKIEYIGTLDEKLFSELCSMVKVSRRVAPKLLKTIFP